MHCTKSGEYVYNKRLPATPEEASLTVLTGEQLEVECYGSLDLVVHCGEGEGVPVTLDNVAVVPQFALEHVMSTRQMSKQGPVVLGPSGVSAFGGRLRFVHGSTSNYVQATRMPRGGTPAR